MITLDPLLRPAALTPRPSNLPRRPTKNWDTPNAVATLRQVIRELRDVNLYLDFAHISYLHQSFQVGIDVVSEGIAQVRPCRWRRCISRAECCTFSSATTTGLRLTLKRPTKSIRTSRSAWRPREWPRYRQVTWIVPWRRSKPSSLASQMMRICSYLQADILSQKGAAPGTPEFQNGHAFRQRSRGPPQLSLGEARSVLAKARPAGRAESGSDRTVQEGSGDQPEGSDRAISSHTGVAEDGEQEGDSRFAEAPGLSAEQAAKRSAIAAGKPIEASVNSATIDE